MAVSMFLASVQLSHELLNGFFNSSLSFFCLLLFCLLCHLHTYTHTKKKQECPEGVVHEDSFKDIYAKFFPHGSKFYLFYCILLLTSCVEHCFYIFSTLFFSDSSIYAHYVFKAFDVNCNGAISFRDLLVTLSTLLRGSVYERLRWTFKLYDLNGDGCISRSELAEVISAVHELMGRKPQQQDDDRKTRDQVSKIVFERVCYITQSC